MTDARKSLADLAVMLADAERAYLGKRVLHVKSAEYYRITGLQFRESDMSIEVTYSPQGEFYGTVRFARTLAEMDFGRRFIFDDRVPGQVGGRTYDNMRDDAGDWI